MAEAAAAAEAAEAAEAAAKAEAMKAMSGTALELARAEVAAKAAAAALALKVANPGSNRMPKNFLQLKADATAAKVAELRRACEEAEEQRAEEEAQAARAAQAVELRAAREASVAKLKAAAELRRQQLLEERARRHTESTDAESRLVEPGGDLPASLGVRRTVSLSRRAAPSPPPSATRVAPKAAEARPSVSLSARSSQPRLASTSAACNSSACAAAHVESATGDAIARPSAAPAARLGATRAQGSAAPRVTRPRIASVPLGRPIASAPLGSGAATAKNLPGQVITIVDPLSLSSKKAGASRPRSPPRQSAGVTGSRLSLWQRDSLE